MRERISSSFRDARRCVGSSFLVPSTTCGLDRMTIPSVRIVSSRYLPSHTCRLRTAIDHNGLTGAELLLHQKQIGLCNVMSFADSSHRQTLADTFKELLPFF